MRSGLQGSADTIRVVLEPLTLLALAKLKRFVSLKYFNELVQKFQHKPISSFIHSIYTHATVTHSLR